MLSDCGSSTSHDFAKNVMKAWNTATTFLKIAWAKVKGVVTRFRRRDCPHRTGKPKQKAMDVQPAIDQISEGGMEFDSYMGDMRNTALEMGSAASQAMIVDALTGRNDPQKDIAKATQETVKHTKKSRKDISRQTDLMRSGVRVIVQDV